MSKNEETVETVAKRGRVRIDDVWLKHYKAGGTLHDVAAELGCSYGGGSPEGQGSSGG